MNAAIKVLFPLAFWFLVSGCCQNRQNGSILQVTFTPLCDDQKGIFLDPAKKAKYGRDPYNLKSSIFHDTALLSFEFISDCCRQFSGDSKVENDTVTLYYFNIGRNVCDCYCDYRMTYRVLLHTDHWNKMTVLTSPTVLKSKR
jgi:hypothetical protein